MTFSSEGTSTVWPGVSKPFSSTPVYSRAFPPRTRNSAMRLPMLIALLASAAPAHAEFFCVSDSAGFAAALESARTNEDLDDTIRLRLGTYPSPPTGFAPVAPFAAGDSITIEGGWWDSNEGPCTEEFSTSTLDGAGSRPVLRLEHAAGGGDITLRKLVISNGKANGLEGNRDQGGGLSIEAQAGYVGTVTIELCRFQGNSAIAPGGAGHLGNHGGTLVVRNNFFLGNNAPSGAALQVYGDGGAIHVANNTFGLNVPTINGAAGTAFGVAGTNAVTLTNNVFWLNAFSAQHDLLGPAQVLIQNDIQRIGQAPAPGSSGNLSVDPRFEDGDFTAPSADSPLVNAGNNTPLGGLTEFDLNGRARVNEGTVDIGAYETEFVFRDGFE